MISNQSPSAAAAHDPLLRVDGLVKHFPVRRGFLQRQAGSVRAVDNVFFELYPGETLGLVGESGCGKSTTGRLVARLTPTTGGKIVIDGRDITRLRGRDLRWMRRDVQMVLQDPVASLDRRVPVGLSIAEPLRIHGQYHAAGGIRRVEELLSLVGLRPSDMYRLPREFSGGQRQRICIARALALQPRLLILDEPVSALDVSVQAQIINLLRDLQEKLGVAYLFIAHDLAVVRHISQKVAVMYLGKIVEYGTATQVFDAPTHPYTQALLSAAPGELDGAGRERIILAGELPDPAHPPTGCGFRTRCWKATDLCAQQSPELVDRLSIGHPSRCHFPQVQSSRRDAE